MVIENGKVKAGSLARIEPEGTVARMWEAIEIYMARKQPLIVIAGAGWLLHGVLRRWVMRPSGMTMFVAIAIGAATLAVAPRAQAQARAAQTRSTMAGVYTAEQARQGREVFTGTCTGCHTPAAHTGPVFTTKWVGRSVDDLFTYIRNSMPKIAPGSLSEDEYVWVTAYILKLNGMPPGTSELSAEPAMMRAVRIDTVRTAKAVKAVRAVRAVKR